MSLLIISVLCGFPAYVAWRNGRWYLSVHATVRRWGSCEVRISRWYRFLRQRRTFDASPVEAVVLFTATASKPFGRGDSSAPARVSDLGVRLRGGGHVLPGRDYKHINPLKPLDRSARPLREEADVLAQHFGVTVEFPRA